jgi:hypothetical protein
LKKVLLWLGTLVFIGAAVMAVVKTSLIWGAVSMAGMLTTFVVGPKGDSVDHNADSGYWSPPS